MSQNLNTVAVIGIDIGKNSFHVVGHDQRGAIVLHQRWSRSQVAARFANMPPCLIGMEACVGAHHVSRQLKALGHDARLGIGPSIERRDRCRISWKANQTRLTGKIASINFIPALLRSPQHPHGLFLDSTP